MPRKISPSTQSLMTPENQERLRDVWQVQSADLFARDGNSPKVPGGGHNVKGSEQLQHAINFIFASYVALFAERETSKKARPASVSPERIQLEQAYARYDIAVMTRRHYRLLTKLLGDENSAKNLLGAIIKRSNRSFIAVFGPESGLQKVLPDYIDNPDKYRPASPRPSRVR